MQTALKLLAPEIHDGMIQARAQSASSAEFDARLTAELARIGMQGDADATRQAGIRWLPSFYMFLRSRGVTHPEQLLSARS